MMRWAKIEYLYALWMLIPLIGLYVLKIRSDKKRIQKIGAIGLISTLMPDKPKYKNTIRFILLLLGFTFLVLAIANPLIGSKLKNVKREGSDVVIALDISRSMLAQDLKPSRMERSKQFISKLLDALSGDRVAFVVFAGNAYMQMPLTYDHNAARIFLNTISTDLAPTQGTAISEAIELALSAFKKDSKAAKVMFILTDGEDHEGNLKSMIESASEQGLTIFTLGVGTAEGSPIPIIKNGTMQGFLKDKEGNVVVSKMDNTALMEIASATKGYFYQLAGGNDIIQDIDKKMEKMAKGESEARVFSDYDSQFQYFLFFAIIYLLLEFALSDRKSNLLGNLQLFNEKGGQT